MILRPSDKLGAVHREWHTRKNGCYIVFDRYNKVILLSQRLPLIASFLNSMASTGAERVSLSALHQIVGTRENRVGGYSKHRWKLSFCKLEDVSEHFERSRGAFEKAMILGAPAAYCIESC